MITDSRSMFSLEQQVVRCQQDASWMDQFYGDILLHLAVWRFSDGRCRCRCGWPMSIIREACMHSIGPGGSQVPEEVRREPACHSGGVMVPSHHLMFGRQTSRLHRLTPAPPISGHIDRLAIYTCMCLFMPAQHLVIWEAHVEVP